MRKTLDHRTSKTYDIKPVDKRGELDVEKIKEGEELVKLSQLERAEKNEQLLLRFKKEQKRVSQESLIFDIGAGTKEEVVRLREEEEIVEEEVQEERVQEEEREKAPKQQIIQTKDFEEIDSPEEVFEKFTANFKEESQVEEVGQQVQKRQESAQQKEEMTKETDEYRVLQGNALLGPQEAPEIKVSKFEFSGLQMINEAEFGTTRKHTEVEKEEEIVIEKPEEEKQEEEHIYKKTEIFEQATEVYQAIENTETEAEKEIVKEVREPKKRVKKEIKKEARFISQELVIEKESEVAQAELTPEESRKEKLDNWISKEAEDAEVLRKRALAKQLQKKAEIIESNRLAAEAEKAAKQQEEENAEQERQRKAEESRLAWKAKFEEEQKRKAKAWVARKKAAELQLQAEEEECEELEQKIQAKTQQNEPIIEEKLNNWFEVEKKEEQASVKLEARKEKEEVKEEEIKQEELPKLVVKEDVTEAFEPTLEIERVEEGDQEPSSKEVEFAGKISKQFLKQEKDEVKVVKKEKKQKTKIAWGNVFSKQLLSFAATCFVAFLVVGSVIFVSYGFQVQENVKVKGQQALSYLDDAKGQLKNQDFLSAKSSFASAVEEFEQAQKELDLIGGDMLNVFSKLPVLSRISSGKNVVDAGNELTKAAKELSGAIEVISDLENPFAMNADEDTESAEEKASMLDMFLVMQEKLKVAHENLESAEENLALVNVSDLPVEYQEKFQKIKDTLPIILSMIDAFEQNSEIFLEILGHNGPRKYLLIFQNNQEMRATGGFIGSYGILHIADGKIKKLLIEGIYNPDGQLKRNIVPPLPIQKISAGWSTHDANWFPHFPTTAEKIAMFYEYTGGPTVDGIITMTPVVLQRMLSITGPIEMEDYDTTVNADNFVKATQYEVEVDYDKTENKPKQFLADLAPKVITQILDSKDPGDASEILEMFSDMLKERHIMIHSFNKDLQEVVSKRGWSGEILQTEKDYLMVVNSNINGFKTDGVVDETISHSSKIAEDGTITNTVKIKRVHNGGDTDYEWWNKVNCDYMRVYVPEGSKLVSVKGQTREINESPLDYDKLGFKRDEDVVAEEESIELDEETGTRTYTEEGKTVFANWVYVSPKETVEIEYVYELPFKLDLSKNDSAADTYSLLVQKQSGSVGSEFSSVVEYETNAEPIWMYPQSLERKGNVLDVETTLETDLFFGTVFQKK